MARLDVQPDAKIWERINSWIESKLPSQGSEEHPFTTVGKFATEMLKDDTGTSFANPMAAPMAGLARVPKRFSKWKPPPPDSHMLMPKAQYQYHLPYMKLDKEGFPLSIDMLDSPSPSIADIVDNYRTSVENARQWMDQTPITRELGYDSARTVPQNLSAISKRALTSEEFVPKPKSGEWTSNKIMEVKRPPQTLDDAIEDAISNWNTNASKRINMPPSPTVEDHIEKLLKQVDFSNTPPKPSRTEQLMDAYERAFQHYDWLAGHRVNRMTMDDPMIRDVIASFERPPKPSGSSYAQQLSMPYTTPDVDEILMRSYINATSRPGQSSSRYFDPTKKLGVPEVTMPASSTMGGKYNVGIRAMETGAETKGLPQFILDYEGTPFVYKPGQEWYYNTLADMLKRRGGK